MPREALKKTLDIIASSVMLVILSPVLLLTGIAVAATSSGGAIFRQARVGRHGKLFTLLKFRSMTVIDAEAAPAFDPGRTTRVTAVGRILRKTKIDELPQLWNVLVGDMSLVGPRPEVPEWTSVHPELWEIVLSVRPGITDPASIEFRDEETILAAAEDAKACYRDVILPRKLKLSAEYVRHRSFLGDLRVLWKTATAVLGSRTGNSS